MLPGSKTASRDGRPASRLAISLTVVVGAICFGVVFSLAVGAVDISLPTVWSTLLSPDDSPTSRIVWEARLGRAVCALLAGCNLAVAGVLLQGVTRNPLADPGLIGVTAGAGLAATLVLAVLPGKAAMLPLAAFVGALVSALFVFAVSWRPGGGVSPIRMILAGVAVNAILAAVIGFLVTAFADRVPAAMFWMTGSFNGRTWDHVWLMAPYSVVGLVIAWFVQRSMRAMELGDDSAATLGVHVERTRILSFAAAALLAGSAASVAGLVGFIGLVVPHVVRLLLGTNRALLPASALAGGGLLLWSDIAARTVLAPSELAVGIVTGLIGGPYFIALLYRSGWLR